MLIMVLLLGSISAQSITAENVNTNTEWSGSGTITGSTVVGQNSTLTISGDYDIESGASIIVETGSNLIISGSINSTINTKLVIDQSANVSIPIGQLGTGGTVRIIFAEEIIFNITVEINNSTQIWTGEEFDWTGNLDIDNLVVNISHNMFQTVAIESIQISPDASPIETREPSQLSGNGTSIVTNIADHDWTIDVQGSMTVTGNILGANIHCSGDCTLNGAEMSSTGPIEVTGQLIVTDSTLSGGISDEDVIVWDDATISWINSSGTGGTTDNWVNILSSRTIGVQNSNVVAYITGMGYDGRDTSALSDNSTFSPENKGDNTIEIASSERDRMIRWQDGNGDLHSENANIRLVLETPWAVHEYNFGELDKSNHVDLIMPLPYLELMSLEESSSTGTANTRLGVLATVKNSGFDSAAFQFECKTNGTDANIGLTVTTEIQAGETIEVPLNWDTATEGTKTLDCSIYTPVQYDGIDVGGGVVVSTGEVVWDPWDDDGDANLFLPLVIGSIIGIVFFIAAARVVKQKENLNSSEEDKDYSAELDSED